MSTVDYEKKMNSKFYLFFDTLFKIVMSNVLTMILSLTIIGIYPAICASIATLREDTHRGGFFKAYFRNLVKYLKKSIFTGIIAILILGIASFAIYFYSEARLLIMNRELLETVFSNIFHLTIDLGSNTGKTLDFFLTAGFVVNVVLIFLTLVVVGNLPFIFINFPVLTLGESIRTSFYISMKYFMTALICFICNMVSIGLFASCLFEPRLLAIYLLIGIGLPLFLEVKFTYVVYERAKTLNIERIMHDYGEDYE